MQASLKVIWWATDLIHHTSMKLHIVHNWTIPNQIRKTEPELQEILGISGKLLSVSALSYAICKIQSISITIKEMQNIAGLILKQKKLGRYLLGLMCQISALHYTRTIIQFPNTEKAGKWELEKHIIDKQFEHRKILRFAYAQLWFVLASPAHINWSNKIHKNKLWGLKEECFNS